MIRQLALKYDNLGILTSFLCLVHCMATPFLFIAKSCSASCCSAAPTWWALFDLIFLFMALTAIYFVFKNKSKIWLKISFATVWGALAFIILNESVELISLPAQAIYIPSAILIGLHFYNRKHCCSTFRTN